MFEMLKKLCMLNGASGDEGAVRDFIINEIDSCCQYSVDALGSITAFKRGKNRAVKKVMFSAHMDEVAFIITHITEDGYLKFAPVGSIDVLSVLAQKVTVNGYSGIVGSKPVHLQGKDENGNVPEFSDLYIDIGACCKKDAEKTAAPGDFAYFAGEFYEMGLSCIKSKAIDDRIGCALMIELIKSDLPYDAYFCFNVQEEVGLRGAQCTAAANNYDVAVVIEATTALDIAGVEGEKCCCRLGGGAVVSFMDGRTLYDKDLYETAFKTAHENGIKVQTKSVIAGGNDAGAIQTAGSGCRVLAVSLPCRYIHTSSSVMCKDDVMEMQKLIEKLLFKLYD
ncbi:MAG: M42 family peptidase [Clostridiales bacterium]|nr:M42 family peptidase [Clostridiales bacterium]